MHELLVAKYYPNAIDTSFIKVRCNYWYSSTAFHGGVRRMRFPYDDYLANRVKDITGVETYIDGYESDDDGIYFVQLNFYRKGSRLAPHIDDNTNNSVIVQLRGTKKISFYDIKDAPETLHKYVYFKYAKHLETITLSPGDVLHIDMKKSRKLKIGHGVPTCNGRSATAVIRD